MFVVALYNGRDKTSGFLVFIVSIYKGLGYRSMMVALSLL